MIVGIVVAVVVIIVAVIIIVFLMQKKEMACFATSGANVIKPFTVVSYNFS